MSERGRIIKGVGGLYTVRLDGKEVKCRARGTFRREGLTPLVGDYVETDGKVITAILPRKNSLIRPACANLDKLILVAAFSSPDPSLYTLDKMLTVAFSHGIEPVLVFNKKDLSDVCGLSDVYAKVPVKRYELCAESDPDGALDGLREEIKGCTVAFSGLSGVGKSTLINRLDPSVHRETGAVSEKLERGKHTTRCVELFDVCGGEVMDTPGFSQLLLEYFDISADARLDECFPEFAPYAGKCRFSDCRHVCEPDCAVRDAVAQAEISQSRYDSYCQMMTEK